MDSGNSGSIKPGGRCINIEYGKDCKLFSVSVF